jgi:hypothetical protein
VTIDYVTYILKTSDMGFDYDTPVLAIHTDRESEIGHLPFVEQVLLNADTHTISPIARGYSPLANPGVPADERDHRLAPVAVSPQWLDLVGEYDGVKVMLVRQPVLSGDPLSSDHPMGDAAPGSVLPDWLARTLDDTLAMALQNVPVTSSFMMTIAAWPTTFDSVEDWAEAIVGPDPAVISD